MYLLTVYNLSAHLDKNSNYPQITFSLARVGLSLVQVPDRLTVLTTPLEKQWVGNFSGEDNFMSSTFKGALSAQETITIYIYIPTGKMVILALLGTRL